jgi:predicted RNA-binding protein with PUA-like domain
MAKRMSFNMTKQFWLMKSECYTIDDLKYDKKAAWTGVRNYQARNFMRDNMQIGDEILFYHSNAEPSGIYGLAKVVSKPHADPTALDKKDDHYDPKSTKAKPIWECVDVAFVKKFKEPISLTRIKQDPKLDGIAVAQKGSRLSIMPVAKEHFLYISKTLAK